MITVSYTEPPKKEAVPKYPYIGKMGNGLIVLFSGPGPHECEETGVVLSSNMKCYNVGFYSDSWAKSSFERFDGPVTLQNKV